MSMIPTSTYAFSPVDWAFIPSPGLYGDGDDINEMSHGSMCVKLHTQLCV